MSNLSPNTNGSPDRALDPAAPFNLDWHRKQAKSVLKAIRKAEPDALARLAAKHPHFPNPDRIVPDLVRLHHVQLVIAREVGFESWPRLRHYAGLVSGQYRLTPCQRKRDYYETNVVSLRRMVEMGDRRAREIVRAVHPDFARMTLDEINAETVTDAIARQAVALQHGSEDWPSFLERIEALPAKPNPDDEPMRATFEAMEAGDFGAFAALIKAHPHLVHARSTNGNDFLGMASLCYTRCMARHPGYALDQGGDWLAMIRLLLEEGAEPDSANVKGWTPLHQAACFGNKTLAHVMIDAGATLDLESYGAGGTPLTVALWWGQTEIAEMLAGLLLAPRNLRVAAGLGRIDLLEDMIEADGTLKAGAGENRSLMRTHSGWTNWPVMEGDRQQAVDDAFCFAARNDRTETMAWLLSQGANPECVFNLGSPLMQAITFHKWHSSKWLIEQGVDVETMVSFCGIPQTALNRAAHENAVELLKVMITDKTDLTIRDATFDGSPLAWANHFGHRETVDYLISEHAHRCDLWDLVEAGAPADAVRANLLHPGFRWSARACNALIAAAKAGRADLVQLLIDFGAPPDIIDEDRKTARDHADAAGHSAVSTILRTALGLDFHSV